ncbi:MAG TPA: hypothetical protein VKS20_12520 [Candidatus Acidoferrales bacterium]|nr:hypothetical protein [Candidatus Acidoferrales bacterium]
MKKLLILACLLAVPCVSRAQSNKAAWENLNALQPGQKIQVIDKSKGKHSGTFLSADGQSIKLHEKSGDSSIERENVARVTVPAHRARHALLGLAIGAGSGAGIAAAAAPGKCGPSTPYCVNPLSKGAYAGIGAALGAVAGAVIGALLPAHKTIYQAR